MKITKQDIEDFLKVMNEVPYTAIWIEPSGGLVLYQFNNRWHDAKGNLMPDPTRKESTC